MATKAAARSSPKTHRVTASASTSTSRRARASSPAQQAEEFRRDGGGYQGQLLGSFSVERDLTATERAKLLRLSRLNYKRSGIYGQVIDTLVNFAVGDGAVVSCKSPAAQTFWDRFASRPENSWDRTYPQRVTTLLVDGEYVLTLTVPMRGMGEDGKAILSGNVLVGRLEPESIEETETSQINVDRLLGFTFRPDGAKAPIRLPIAAPNVTLRDNGDGTATAAQLWRVNTLGRRGVPYLSRSLDKATMLDAVVDELARKAEYSSRFWLWATYESTGDGRENKALERKLLTWLRSWTPGEAAVTTSNVKVQAVAPNLAIPDVRAFVEMLLEYILGSHGIPRMWYSAGGDTNRATAVEQGTPIHRALDRLQSLLRADLEDLVRFVLWVGKASAILPSETSDECSVTMADVATRDSIRDVNELTGLVVALDNLFASRIISDAERQAIGRRALQGKSFGDLIRPEGAPPLQKPGLSAPPPGSMPGFPPANPTGDTGMGAAPEAGRGPTAVLPPGA